MRGELRERGLEGAMNGRLLRRDKSHLEDDYDDNTKVDG